MNAFRPVGSVALRGPVWACAVLVLTTTAFAKNADDQAAAAASCAVCSTFLLIPVAFFVLSVTLLVWVAKDARARGMDVAILWMLLVFFLNLLGFLIYIFARPQGTSSRVRTAATSGCRLA